MLEVVIIGILFIGAVGYLLSQLKNAFKAKEQGCAKGCGTCAATDSSAGNAAKSASVSQIHS
jgi:hypothetical protein